MVLAHARHGAERKISRFVESPPRPTPKSVWRQIEILRSACLAETFIDPASDECRKVLTPPKDGVLLEMWFWHMRDTEPSVQEAIVLLLNTPRAFKWALRLTWETWARLCGEIDFDSVLVISALRAARPDEGSLQRKLRFGRRNAWDRFSRFSICSIVVTPSQSSSATRRSDRDWMSGRSHASSRALLGRHRSRYGDR